MYSGIASKEQEAFFRIVNHPVKFRMFLLRNLPAAWFSGVRVKQVSTKRCQVVVPYKWFTRNPFRSTYFACLSMAAEMSTGVLAMSQVYRRVPQVALLVVAVEGRFIKKATGVTSFTCEQGEQIKEAVERALHSGEGQQVTLTSVGRNEDGEEIAVFKITWSFRMRQK
jgi:hypothetical protein